jgi:hypothetical protein
MWQSQVERLPKQAGQRITISMDGRALPFADVISLWQQNQGFRSFLSSLLTDAPYEAYRWETPAVSSSSTNREFEFVLLDCPGLATTPTPNSFEEHFRSDTIHDNIVTFSNLGKDAILVVPTPISPTSSYGHLAAFMRTAPEAQKHALWRAVGEAMQLRISQKPVWLSTAGMGVAWLHVRLDDRPKYYGYSPYRNVH